MNTCQSTELAVCPLAATGEHYYMFTILLRQGLLRMVKQAASLAECAVPFY